LNRCAFGHGLEYELAGQLTVLACLRYTDEKQDFDYSRVPSYVGDQGGVHEL